MNRLHTPSCANGITVHVPERDGSGNELQSLAFGGTSGGTATLSFNGVSGTAATVLTFTTGSSPTAAQVLAHLNSIGGLSGNVAGPSVQLLTGGRAALMPR